MQERYNCLNLYLNVQSDNKLRRVEMTQAQLVSLGVQLLLAVQVAVQAAVLPNKESVVPTSKSCTPKQISYDGANATLLS